MASLPQKKHNNTDNPILPVVQRHPCSRFVWQLGLCGAVSQDEWRHGPLSLDMTPMGHEASTGGSQRKTHRNGVVFRRGVPSFWTLLGSPKSIWGLLQKHLCAYMYIYVYLCILIFQEATHQKHRVPWVPESELEAELQTY